MATATFTLAADFKEAVMEGAVNLASDTIMFEISNTAPASEASNPLTTGNGILANVTAVSHTNYADDLTTDFTLENVTSNESGGTYTLDFDDFQISASSGTLATFQYIWVYDATHASDLIIGVYTISAAVSLADTQTCDVAINANGCFEAA